MTNENLALAPDFEALLQNAIAAAKGSKGNFLPSDSQEGLALIQHVLANKKAYQEHVDEKVLEQAIENEMQRIINSAGLWETA